MACVVGGLGLYELALVAALAGVTVLRVVKLLLRWCCTDGTGTEIAKK